MNECKIIDWIGLFMHKSRSGLNIDNQQKLIFSKIIFDLISNNFLRQEFLVNKSHILTPSTEPIVRTEQKKNFFFCLSLFLFRCKYAHVFHWKKNETCFHFHKPIFPFFLCSLLDSPFVIRVPTKQQDD
mgnify:CR=1 FL=1